MITGYSIMEKNSFLNRKISLYLKQIEAEMAKEEEKKK